MEAIAPVALPESPYASGTAASTIPAGPIRFSYRNSPSMPPAPPESAVVVTTTSSSG